MCNIPVAIGEHSLKHGIRDDIHLGGGDLAAEKGRVGLVAVHAGHKANLAKCKHVFR